MFNGLRAYGSRVRRAPTAPYMRMYSSLTNLMNIKACLRAIGLSGLVMMDLGCTVTASPN